VKATFAPLGHSKPKYRYHQCITGRIHQDDPSPLRRVRLQVEYRSRSTNTCYQVVISLDFFPDRCVSITCSTMSPISRIESSSSQSAREPILNKYLRLQDQCQRKNDARRDLSVVPFVQCIHSAPAILFSRALAREIRLNQDAMSFTSLN
jgi:hypothetical protein